MLIVGQHSDVLAVARTQGENRQVPKIKVDTTGVETEQGAVKPGLYPVKIKDVELKEAKSSGNEMLALIYEIQGGDHDGRVLYDYIVLDDASAFRLAALQDALGLKRKTELDTDKLVGKKLQVRTVVQKSDEYGEQARVRNLLPAKGAAQTDEDLDDDGDDDDEVDYEEMDLAELKEELEAREIELEGKVTKKKAIKALEEDDEESEDDEDEDDEDAEDESEDEDADDDSDDDEDDDDDDEEEDEEQDYSEMDLGELKEAAKEKKIKSKGLKKKELVKALEEADEEDEQDYSEMDLQELKDECKERGLKTAGKKKDLIERLEKDDGEGEDGEPF